MESGTSQPPAMLRWSWLGRVPFTATAELQERLREEVAGGAPPILLLCEHDPVITLGRSAHKEHVLASSHSLAAAGVALAPATRGGDVTYHGPGQIVGYPIMRLHKGVVAHVEGMAEAIIQVLASFGIEGHFRRAQPGVWVGEAKICAFGVHVRRRVAIHGFALNVKPDLRHFDFIVPCGLADARVTSLAELLPMETPTIGLGCERLVHAFGHVTGLRMRHVAPASIAAAHLAALH